jgi:hypothetical protein
MCLGYQWARGVLVFILLLVSISLFLSAIDNVPTKALVVDLSGLSEDLRWFRFIFLLVASMFFSVATVVIAFSRNVSDFSWSKTPYRMGERTWQSFLVPPEDSISEQATGAVPEAKQIEHVLEDAHKRSAVYPIAYVGVGLAVVIGILVAYSAYSDVSSEIQSMIVSSKQRHAEFWGYVGAQDGFTKKLGGGIAGAVIVGLVSVLDHIFSILKILFHLLSSTVLFYIAPALMLLPIALPTALRWRQPGRFLLLRPFNRKHLTGSLKTIISRELGPFGHIYTLSDTTIKLPLYARIPFLLGSLSYLSYRLRKIRRPKHLYQAVVAIQRMKRRSLNWVLSLSKIFPVPCDDYSWKASVARLSQEMDVVIVDLTGCTENVLWEIELCKSFGLVPKLVFIVSENDYDSAHELLANSLGDAITEVPIINYSPSEKTIQSRFITEIARRVIARSTARVDDAPVRESVSLTRRGWLRHELPTVGLAMFMFIGAFALNSSLKYTWEAREEIEELTSLKPNETWHTLGDLSIKNLVISPSGEILVSIDDSGNVEFRRTHDGSIHTWSIPGSIETEALAFFPKRNMLITGTSRMKDNVVAWTIAGDSLQETKAVDLFGKPKKIFISEDGSMIGIYTFFGLTVLSGESLEAVQKIERIRASTIAFSPTGDALLSSDYYGTLRVRAIRGNALVLEPKMIYDNIAKEFSIGNNGTMIVTSAGENNLSIRRFYDLSEIQRIEAAEGEARSVRMHPLWPIITWTDSRGAWIYNLNTKQRRKLNHEGDVNDFAFHPHEKTLYAATSGGRVLVWRNLP